ncbi:2-hydroxychromene-2-carboxylate isomerase [Burkholderia lata]|uniref:2-hydroxychromene-2-carboxylate isomerase n=1 Tax=Burkholderia lata (strain ATCC 17760 / DSM 23089 / LMG 22485 / NCIMB 9086 / R18194 / 383) TaxID=482957 RepID=A0A6P2VCF7_BURL3|nr:2-hydroxychromene-2-carboxylate isomerase [Burkholderia lata]VWC76867.1 2-hydroxychromene-2-carboxylate isomerase [Burkholderia lata]
MKKIDYYFWINSDWAYLGADRLVDLAARYQATINYMPVDLPFVYSQTGGILLSQRSSQRRNYRLIELKRWTTKLGIHLNFEPKFMCPNGNLASCLVIAAKRRNLDAGALAKAILHAEWVLDQDISDPKTLSNIVRELGYDVDDLMMAADLSDVRAEYDHYTREAIAAGAFGSPSYVYKSELFWGQDRLEFLEEALANED